MTCTTVTVVAPVPSLQIISITARDIGSQWISVNVSTTGAGTGRILIDGVEKERFIQPASLMGYGSQFQVTPGTHTVCAEAV